MPGWQAKEVCLKNMIRSKIRNVADVLSQASNDLGLLSTIESMAHICINAIKQDNKILFVGNGGSAADAQHLAAELVGRLHYDRPGLAALALTTDTSVLTAIGNDDAFENIFSRQVEAIGRPGDVLVGLSTSGQSENVLRALKAARAKKMKTLGLTGRVAPKMGEVSDIIVYAPSSDTSTIQECHIVFGHILCETIEATVCGHAIYDKI